MADWTNFRTFGSDRNNVQEDFLFFLTNTFNANSLVHCHPEIILEDVLVNFILPLMMANGPEPEVTEKAKNHDVLSVFL